MFERERAVVQEHHPDAVFVEEMALRNKHGGYSQEPCLVFYQEKPPKPEYPNFFAYNRQPINGDMRWVRTGLPATFSPVVPALFDDGVLIISRYGHDFVRSPVSENCVDGGPQLERVVGPLAHDAVRYIVNVNLLTLTFEMGGRTRTCVRWKHEVEQ
jgi:hypothetical protein